MFQFILRLFGNDEELMTNRMLISLWDPYKACGNQAICENLQFLITGFDPSRADQVTNNEFCLLVFHVINIAFNVIQ